jgi:hypothetical protein
MVAPLARGDRGTHGTPALRFRGFRDLRVKEVVA